jgi:hypothetical protein
MKPVRREHIRRDVLDAIANDYETFAMVLSEVRKWNPEFVVTDGEVLTALRSLVAEGLAKAYLLSSQPPHVTELPFEEGMIAELYFYATKAGVAIANSQESQPPEVPKVIEK